jgi:hypothetical protein
MIIKEFSEFLKKHIEENVPPTELLARWLKYKLSIEPKSDVDKIIHAEIKFEKDKRGKIFFTSKTKTGKSLIESLYNFAQSFDQQNFNRWLHEIKASDFKH